MLVAALLFSERTVEKLASHQITPEEVRQVNETDRIVIDSVAEAPVLGTRVTPFGVLYETLALVDGLNGTTAPVAAIWIVEEDHPPRLVSTWVDIP